MLLLATCLLQKLSNAFFRALWKREELEKHPLTYPRYLSCNSMTPLMKTCSWEPSPALNCLPVDRHREQGVFFRGCPFANDHTRCLYQHLMMAISQRTTKTATQEEIITKHSCIIITHSCVIAPAHASNNDKKGHPK